VERGSDEDEAVTRSSLAEIARTVGSFWDNNAASGQTEVVDVITFIEEWAGRRLFPAQRVILKAHYGLALDDSPAGFSEELLASYSTVDLLALALEEDPKVSGQADRAQLIRTIMRKTVVIYDDDAPWRKTPASAKWLTEREYLHYLYDNQRANIREVIPGEERREMILSVGRRSGKTELSAIIAAYETYKLLAKGDPQLFYGLPNGETIQLISVATDRDQASILYGKVKAIFNDTDYFAAHRANSTQTFAKFQTARDIQDFGRFDGNAQQASINVTFRSCIAKGLRGPGNIVAILDEIAHFTDAGQSSAEEVYKAISPSLSTFTPKDPDNRTKALTETSDGRMILISSPLGRQGKFFELFQMAMKGGSGSANMLAIQAPTWEINPTIPPGEYEKEYAKDPIQFITEFGGEFSSRTLGWIEVRKDLLECVDPTLRQRTRGLPRVPHFMGIDFALAQDGTAVAIGHIEGPKVILDYIDEIRAGTPGPYENHERLDYEEVADWIRDLSKKFLIEEGMFDQWAGIIFEQALAKRGLAQIKTQHLTGPLSSQIFKNFKDLMYERLPGGESRLVLYDDMPDKDKTGMSEDAYREALAAQDEMGEGDDPKEEEGPISYLQELLELQATIKSKYIVEVKAPNLVGKHDDRSDALVRMVWLASQRLGNIKYISGQIAQGVGPNRHRISEGAVVKARMRAMQSGSHEHRTVRQRQGHYVRPVLGVRGGRLKG